MPAVRLMNLTKRFGRTTAVENLDLEIHDGEILTLLGPSGCGKTTTLRCIAGFLLPDEGDIYLGDNRVTNLPPERRGIGFVFQNYALWPHMTVYENLAFGLELRKISKEEIRERVQAALSMVRLSGFEERYPRQLSGGQQQRVALARALVIKPGVLLLDEPLSNLDAQLREEMRFEIRELQKELDITTVYVTHDQAEALVLSDRIAILHEGRVMQVGTPQDIYDRPENKFVAGFIGLSSFIEGSIADLDDGKEHVIVKTEDSLQLRVRATDLNPGQKVTLAIRPEHIRLYKDERATQPAEMNLLEGRVTRAAYLGDMIDYRIRVGGWVIRAHTDTDQKMLSPEEKVIVAFSPDQVMLIPE